MTMTLEILLVELNEKLLADNRDERFEFAEYTFKKKSWKGLKLRHPIDPEKTIDLFEDGSEYIAEFLDTHEHISLNEEENASETIYREIADILDDKLLIVNERTKRGKLVMSAFVYLLPEISDYEYLEDDYELIKRDTITFQTWSGNITEELKLFAVGYVYTDHPKIEKDVEKVWREKFGEYYQKKEILWSGEMTGLGKVVLPLKIFGSMFLILMSLIGILTIWGGWPVFVFMSGCIVIAFLIAIPIVIHHNKYISFTVDEDSIYSAWTSFFLKDIVSLKLKYGLFGKKRNIGTIKFKVKGKWHRITSMNNHLYFIENPDQVYAIIQSQIQKINEKIV